MRGDASAGLGYLPAGACHCCQDHPADMEPACGAFIAPRSPENIAQFPPGKANWHEFTPLYANGRAISKFR